MPVTFSRIRLPGELEELRAVDRLIFPDEDPLPDEYLLREKVEAYWILDEGQRAGAVIVELDAFPGKTYSADSVPAPGVVYSVSVGVLPGKQRRGYGSAARRWMIAEAPFCKSRRWMVSNLRASNGAVLALNLGAGFEHSGILRGYYEAPSYEDTLVMMRRIG